MTLRRSTLRMASCLFLVALLLVTAAGCGDGGGEADGTLEISWSSPGQGDEVFGIARLKVNASSDEGISEVSFYHDAVDDAHLIGTVSSPTESVCTQLWYTSDVANGEHTLHAVALDEQDQSTQASRMVTVANVTRAEAIEELVTWNKWTAQMDAHDPVLSAAFSSIFYDPVPMEAPITTAGAEDSPFITPDGNNFYFVFVPNMSIPAQQQLTDRVSGIYWSQKAAGAWTEPQRVWLYDGLSLDGAETVQGNTMWFCSVRPGNSREIDMYTAQLANGRWSNWTSLGELLNVTYDVGELHVTADGSQIYYHSKRAGGHGGRDIWVTSKVNGQWQAPQNVDAANSEYDDGYPFVSEDGNELWFTRGPGAPSIYRSLKVNGQWQTPQLVVSSLAGESTMDSQGNLYFVHHYWDDAAQKLCEADIYVCRRR
jgi:hypothetical protein